LAKPPSFGSLCSLSGWLVEKQPVANHRDWNDGIF